MVRELRKSTKGLVSIPGRPSEVVVHSFYQISVSVLDP